MQASQLLNNQYIWGYRHLYSASWHALIAKTTNRMISKTLSMEVLLYAAGYRQIKKAINLLGVSENVQNIAGLFIGKTKEQVINANDQLQQELDLILDTSLLEDFSTKKNLFIEILNSEGFNANNFTFSEIEKAILQKIALLALES